MKKLTNAIFGRESRYHDETKGEMVESEKHLHPAYEGLPAMSGVAPISIEQHKLHHLHHAGWLTGNDTCNDCKTFHSSDVCLYCKPSYFFTGCDECIRLKSTGLVLPVWSEGFATPGTTTMGMGGLSQDVNSERLRKERLERELAAERTRFSTGPTMTGNFPPTSTMTPIASVTQTQPYVGTSTSMLPTEEVILENRARPAVIHEKVFPVEREEIQPIIHRDREKTEILQVEAPVYESEIRPTVIHERQLPAEVRPQIVASSAEAEIKLREFQQLHHSTTERAAIEHRVVEKPAIIEEHIKKTVIEEVQPVVHKEVVEPHIIREVKPIYEKIVEAPTVTRLIKEMEGLNLESHYKHHGHHYMVLSGNSDCLDCKNFHQIPEACQLCKPLHFYEGCGDCGKLRERGINLAPFPGSSNMPYASTTTTTYFEQPISTGMGSVGPTPVSFSSAPVGTGLSGNIPLGTGLSGKAPLGTGYSTNVPIGTGLSGNVPLGTGLSGNVPLGTSTASVGPTGIGLKEGPATTSVSQKRNEPILKSM